MEVQFTRRFQELSEVFVARSDHIYARLSGSLHGNKAILRSVSHIRHSRVIMVIWEQHARQPYMVKSGSWENTAMILIMLGSICNH